MPSDTSLLIIGAGPFGLAVARLARERGVDHLLVGEPMAFWRHHMPAGMYLRSAGDWHLDPCEVLTIERFLEVRGQARADVEPLSRALYLEYVDWFARESGLRPLGRRVTRIDQQADGRFTVSFSDGEAVRARRVVVAVGFQYFDHVPPDLAARLPPGAFAHTRDMVDFDACAGRRMLIAGGRQSAFEWAALMDEAGAASIEIVHRHDTPRFAESDWTWVAPLVARFEEDPGWYRRLTADDQEAIGRRLWAEGRLKLEPWLEPRCRSPKIRVRPRTAIASAHRGDDDAIDVTYDTGEQTSVDGIVLATGYKPDVRRVPFLEPLLPRLRTRGGCPALDDGFQTSVPGLFATSMLATAEFGPFFAFTGAARTSARLILHALTR